MVKVIKIFSKTLIASEILLSFFLTGHFIVLHNHEHFTIPKTNIFSNGSTYTFLIPQKDITAHLKTYKE